MRLISLKIDVDTERGTRVGVPNLLDLFGRLGIHATFLYSLGPDNTGRALKRIFRPGFLKKVSRTSVVSTYGFRTLLNGVLFPGPHIGRRHANIMRQSQQLGHEVGIHTYDHCDWQDYVLKWSKEKVFEKFQLSLDQFQQVFCKPAKSAGAAGWQANEYSLAAYDSANLLYGSDCRGQYPFFPRVGESVFKTIQIPSTLPTLDELLGRPEYPLDSINSHFFELCERSVHPNIFTLHAELEGMKYLAWFEQFLGEAMARGYQFVTMEQVAKQYLANPAAVPVNDFIQGSVDGRSGFLACQKVCE
jgi:undecaprenyl phosphate-alpha-L-ara4FN deformylase